MSNAINVNPIRRNLVFPFNYERLNDWHAGGRHASHFLNTLSLFFPDGEQFFIDSVRHYRDKGVIKNPQLLEDVRNFIGQEAMHRREHIGLNQEMEKRGLGAAGKEKIIRAILNKVAYRQTPAMRLSTTCALEHLTATLADAVLRWEDELLTEDCEPAFGDGWRWHAMEETEHKAVAFDVYQLAVGKDSNPLAYANRVYGQVMANAIFWPLVAVFWLDITRRAGDLQDVKGWAKAINMLVGKKPGMLRKKLPEWFDYFRPGFHPWDLDNREFLQQIDALADRYAKAA